MAIFIYILLSLVGMLISAAVLVLALFLVGGEVINKDTILKSLAIAFAVALVASVPYFGFMAVFIWFIGVMGIFEKDFIQVFIIALAVGVINFLLGLGINAVFFMLFPDAA